MAQAPNNLEEFSKTSRKLNYKHQAIFVLNAYWGDLKEEKDHVWDIAQKFAELDANKEDGYSLDEFGSHRFLEAMGQVLTVVELRNVLKEIDIDTDKRMSLMEYCVYHYKLDVDELMTRPQGVSQALEEAEAKLNDIQAQIVKIKKQKGLWEGKPIPESGPKKVAYDNDMKVLSDAEKYLDQTLDFARKKLKAAEKSKDVQAQGKIWWLSRELEEAQKYAPPKKQLK